MEETRGAGSPVSGKQNRDPKPEEVCQSREEVNGKV